MASNEEKSLVDTESLILNKIVPNWKRDFPEVGKGTLIFSIQRCTAFSIVIRPKLEPGEPGADQWISLEVHKTKARFKLHGIAGQTATLTEITGTVGNEQVGYEGDRKISYWFSYDRDFLMLKYGKGYRMEETTLMQYGFLSGSEEEQKETREKLRYLFSPTIGRRIEQYDIEPKEDMIRRYAARIRDHGIPGVAISAREALDKESEELAKSIIDIETMVAFDMHPFVCNRSPFVLDSSLVSLFDLDDNNYTFSANLPSACLELYSSVTAKNVHLDWSPTPRKYRLSDAIRYSLKGPNGTLYRKLKSKSGEFGGFNETYLRVTLGSNRGSSPGIPYVLEIWPTNHGSPIHSHGNTCAVIKILHGGLTIKVFNKHVDRPDAPALMQFDVKEGDVTWISPNWFQTHQLWNHTDDYCATLQCYQYGTDDLIHWPYFDYVASTNTIGEFLPNSDYSFREMREIVMKEFQVYMDAAN